MSEATRPNHDALLSSIQREEAPLRKPPPPRFKVSDPRVYGVVAGVVAMLTVVNLILQRWIGYVPVSLVYLLSVIVLGVFVGRGPTLAAATLTALSWNFFFTEPHFTFRIKSAADTMMFLTYFVVALAMGHLTARLRTQQAAERKREQRATALYLLIRELAKATDFADLLAVAVREVGKAERLGKTLLNSVSHELRDSPPRKKDRKGLNFPPKNCPRWLAADKGAVSEKNKENQLWNEEHGIVIRLRKPDVSRSVETADRSRL